MNRRDFFKFGAGVVIASAIGRPPVDEVKPPAVSVSAGDLVSMKTVTSGCTTRVVDSCSTYMTVIVDCSGAHIR